MFDLLQVFAVMLVAVAWALSLAHALELPGKLRLDEPTYRAVQRIYYPGFTIAGFAEPAAVLVAAVLLFLTPAGTTAFWLVLIALICMAAMHAILWIVIQPVNKHWMEGQAMSASGASFFRTGGDTAAADWTQLRDRWEHGHVARAGLTSVALLALVASLVILP